MTHEEAETLLTRLLESLVDQPQAMQLDLTELPRRVNWRAKASINDTGKLIGKKGAHLKSLRLLIATLGDNHGEEWRFDVSDPDDGLREDRPAPKRAGAYAWQPMADLLRDLVLALCDEAPTIDFEAGEELVDGDRFIRGTFTIRPAVIQDYELLVEQVGVDGIALNPIAALGTLFRARGGREGVIVKVELQPRRRAQ